VGDCADCEDVEWDQSIEEAEADAKLGWVLALVGESKRGGKRVGGGGRKKRETTWQDQRSFLLSTGCQYLIVTRLPLSKIGVVRASEGTCIFHSLAR
jgi:hypothetical protein